MYYQYELTHFEGDMGHGVASDAAASGQAGEARIRGISRKSVGIEKPVFLTPP